MFTTTSNSVTRVETDKHALLVRVVLVLLSRIICRVITGRLSGMFVGCEVILAYVGKMGGSRYRGEADVRLYMEAGVFPY